MLWYDAPMDFVPKRRWFRFSLRLMFVLWTVVAIWLGWEARIVGKRRAFLASLKDPTLITTGHFPTTPNSFRYRGGTVFGTLGGTSASIKHGFAGPREERLISFSPRASGELSRRRLWLGDKSYQTIIYHDGPPASEARKLFPEAFILVPPELSGIPEAKVRTK